MWRWWPNVISVECTRFFSVERCLTRCSRQREISRSRRSSTVGSQIAGTRSRNDSSASTPESILSVLHASGASPLTFCASATSTSQPCGRELVVHEPGPVHRLHHTPHRLAIHRHPAGEPVQAVAIRDRREAVDQLPLIGDQAHVNSFAAQIQANVQHEHSSPARGQAGSVQPTAYLDTRVVGSLYRIAGRADTSRARLHLRSSIRRADLLPTTTPPGGNTGLHRIPLGKSTNPEEAVSVTSAPQWANDSSPAAAHLP